LNGKFSCHASIDAALSVPQESTAI
jgi:hypothetical protein